MKACVLILLIIALTGCSRGDIDNKEAVRQGVIDYLASRGNLNVGSMSVDVSSVTFKQNEADAVVSFAPKGSGPGQGMTMRYTLERKGNRWVVKPRAESGKNPHGGPMPGEQPGGMPGEAPAGHPPVGGKK